MSTSWWNTYIFIGKLNGKRSGLDWKQFLLDQIT